ncbi:alpha/beta hydrolase [Paenibacillus glycanilyticus]|uniref:alpha/beta fold hydrolase n=1 Tax=Paenibacillus glycanilyticus TaxID=126569 RepID=UPI0020423043|nr:alpha/beta hydrolase [Paenibacillus glycanilyticus]MCM3631657.1 alpha/beta hydrolase [Paenibacillus glycanilyticus]
MKGYLPANQKKIYYEVYGEKKLPTFLYLHGGPGIGSYDFNIAQAQLLAPFIRLISIDQRGCLRSDAIEENEEVTFQTLINDFEAVRNYFNLDSWGIIGHSFGGFLAIEYVSRHPEVIENIILECPTFDMLESLRSVVKKAEHLYKTDGNNRLAELCSQAYSMTQQELFNAFNEIHEKRDQVYVHSLAPDFFDDIVSESGIEQSDWRKQAMFQKKINEQILNSPNIEKLDKVGCPVLLIKGKYDPICSEYQTKELMKRVQNQSVAILKDSSHMPRHEEPNAFAQIIKSFINNEIHGVSSVQDENGV